MFWAGFVLGMVALSMLGYIVYYVSGLGKRRMSQILVALLRNQAGLYPSQIAKESRLPKGEVRSWLRRLAKKRMVDWWDVPRPGMSPVRCYKISTQGVIFLVREIGVTILRSWRI